jgi:hypothetical protein
MGYTNVCLMLCRNFAETFARAQSKWDAEACGMQATYMHTSE